MGSTPRTPKDASIRLTRSNYNGPSLHRPTRGQDTASSSPAQNGTSTEDITLSKRENSVDINAPPASSSDEEELPNAKVVVMPQLEGPHENMAGGAGADKTGVSRSKHSSRARGRTKGRLKDEEDLPLPSQVTQTELTQEDELPASWKQSQISQASQTSHKSKRRRITTYTSQRSQSSADGFKPPPALLSSPQKGVSTSRFSIPALSTASPSRKTRSSLNNGGFVEPSSILGGLATRQKLVPAFSLPPDISIGVISSSTSGADSARAFGLPESPKYFTSKRSNSSSSLSSINSMASLIFTQKEKNAMLTNEDEDNIQDISAASCPLCHERVDSLHLEKFNFGRRLNFRDQQRFCHEHKVREARNIRRERHYPDIDWADLTNTQITKYIPVLRDILQRAIPSYYRDQLDAAMVEGTGSRKTLQRYLKEGVVDVAKHGYYGPKGARVVGHAITTHMATELNLELKNDKVARAAGVGGYVNAVLVPDLIVRLVMDDMKLQDQAQARNVLSESSGIGTLLNGDDEVLIRQKDEDDDDDDG